MKLTKAQKKKVVAALRSGEYKQGTGAACRYRDGEWEMCAVGVMVDVLCDSWWEADYEGSSIYHLSDKDCENAYYSSAIWTRNDAGWTFDQIADYIEENY